MWSCSHLDELIEKTMSELGIQDGWNNKNEKIKLAPSHALIIKGLLGGTLEVISVLVDNDEHIKIVLLGSLDEKKTQT